MGSVIHVDTGNRADDNIAGCSLGDQASPIKTRTTSLAGASCQGATDFSDDEIWSMARRQISACDVVLVEWNIHRKAHLASVMLKVGYAKAIRKTVVVWATDNSTIPDELRLASDHRYDYQKNRNFVIDQTLRIAGDKATGRILETAARAAIVGIGLFHVAWAWFEWLAK